MTETMPSTASGEGDKLVAALTRVGTDDASRFRWLTSFAAVDLSAGMSDDLGWEVAAFIESRRSLPGITVTAVPGESDDDLIAVQQKVRGGLEALRDQGRFPFQPPLDGTLYGWTTMGGRAFRLTVVGTAGLMNLAVLDVLDQVRERLRVCENPACRKLFLFDRPHQKFCSSRCANAVHLKRFRAKQTKQERSEGRHERYVREQRAKVGPKVKVGRRRPGPGK